MNLKEVCARLLAAEKALMKPIRDNMKVDMIRIVLFADGSGEVQADWRHLDPGREMCKEEHLLRAIFTEEGPLFEFTKVEELEGWLKEKGAEG